MVSKIPFGASALVWLGIALRKRSLLGPWPRLGTQYLHECLGNPSSGRKAKDNNGLVDFSSKFAKSGPCCSQATYEKRKIEDNQMHCATQLRLFNGDVLEESSNFVFRKYQEVPPECPVFIQTLQFCVNF